MNPVVAPRRHDRSARATRESAAATIAERAARQPPNRSPPRRTTQTARARWRFGQIPACGIRPKFRARRLIAMTHAVTPSSDRRTQAAPRTPDPDRRDERSSSAARRSREDRDRTSDTRAGSEPSRSAGALRVLRQAAHPTPPASEANTRAVADEKRDRHGRTLTRTPPAPSARYLRHRAPSTKPP